MTVNELKKLSRIQLLEMLLTQTRRVEDLQAQLERLQAQLDEKKPEITDCGSLAQAALQLNDMFADADRVAQTYMEKAMTLRADVEEQRLRRSIRSRHHAEDVIAAAHNRRKEIIRQAEAQRAQLLQQAQPDIITDIEDEDEK